MNLCIIGTGYVGLVIGSCLADLGNHVICIDKDEKKIEMLKNNIMPIYENGLDEICKRNRENGNLVFTSKIDYGIENSDIIFIAVGTPPNEDGSVDLSFVKEVAESIGKYLNSYKVIVNKSTVPIGTQKLVSNVIRKHLKTNCDFDVVSIPEFLREGYAIYDFLNGDRIIIGSESDKATNLILELFEPFNAPIEIMKPESAELVKYSSNAFLATKISFINEVANICGKYGADVCAVSRGMGLDKRISPDFLNAGIGFGGSCFPKDSKALIKIAEKVGYEFKIVKSALEVNQSQKIKPVEMLQKSLKDIDNKTIAILGLSFKPGTDDVRDAPSIEIITKIKELGGRIKAYDPIAIDNAKIVLDNIQFCENLYDTVTEVDAIILLTEWEEFSLMDLSKVKQLANNPVFIDGRNVFEPEYMKNIGFEYYCIGKKDDSNKYSD